MDKNVFFKVLVPLIGVRNFALLGISTPDDEFNYYTQLLELKRDEKSNEPLFKVIRIELACTDCRLSGKAALCPHKKYLLPAWKSGARQELMRVIMSSDPELFARENQGLVLTNRMFLFHRPWIDALFEHERQHYQLTSKAEVIYVAIDPSGGGSGSDYAICSMTRDQGKADVVIGLDCCASNKYEDVKRMLELHFGALRNRPMYSSAHIVLFIEGNMSWLDADRLAHELNSGPYAPIEVESSKVGGEMKYGVWTGAYEKVLYADSLARGLEDRTLHFVQPNEFVSYVAGGGGRDPRAREQLNGKLRDQLRNFRKETKPPADPAFGKVRQEITGKSAGCKDDLVMALSMLLYWNRVKRSRDMTFLAKARERGWTL